MNCSPFQSGMICLYTDIEIEIWLNQPLPQKPDQTGFSAIRPQADIEDRGDVSDFSVSLP
jgi:hypothetical protein